MKNLCRLAAVPLFALLAAVSQAPAAIYTLAFDHSDYTVQSGDTVDVQLLFQSIDPESTSTALFTEGLYSAGGRILFAGGDASISLVSITLGSGFDADTSIFFPPNAFPVEDANNLAGVNATNASFDDGIGVGTNSVHVATFRFAITDESDQTVLIGLDQLDASAGPAGFVENLSIMGVELDNDLSTEFGTATITITPIPEPTTVGMGAALIIAGLSRRRRFAAVTNAKPE